MNIICIVVTYNPQLSILCKSINNLLQQKVRVIIVDNSNIYTNYLSINSDITVIYNGCNLGIAKAQNIGIDYALSQGADFVLFMDQDSLAPNNLVDTLVRCYEQKSKESLVGGVGPLPYNRDNNKAYFTKNNNEEIVEVNTLISSGSFVSREMLVEVGYMDDSLFIDMVDLEWCWRATYKTKCRFYINNKCLLSHSLGKREVIFLRKRIPLHSPMRMYYRFRNYFLLVNRKYVPLSWKFRYPVSNITRLLLCLCYFSEKRIYLKNSYKGFKDGLRCFFHKSR